MRTFLVTFKDNDAAEAFVQRLTRLQAFTTAEEELANSGDLGGEIDRLGTLVAAHAKIDAMMARPAAFCKCPGGTGKGRMGDWKKTEKFGWFVCPTCTRPSVQVVRRFVRNHLGGENNLLPELLAKLFPKPEVVNETTILAGTIQEGDPVSLHAEGTLGANNGDDVRG